MSALCLSCGYWSATNGPLCESCAMVTSRGKIDAPKVTPPGCPPALGDFPAVILARVATDPTEWASVRDVAREALVAKVGTLTALRLLDEAHFTRAIAAHKEQAA